MDTYHVVLYLHLLSLFVLVGGITLVGVCYARLRAAASLIEATPWATLADQTGWVFPPAILGLLATGAYLTNDMWTWGTPWIAVSVAGLVLVTLQGPLVAGRAPRRSSTRWRRTAPARSTCVLVSWRVTGRFGSSSSRIPGSCSASPGT